MVLPLIKQILELEKLFKVDQIGANPGGGANPKKNPGTTGHRFQPIPRKEFAGTGMNSPVFSRGPKKSKAGNTKAVIGPNGEIKEHQLRSGGVFGPNGELLPGTRNSQKLKKANEDILADVGLDFPAPEPVAPTPIPAPKPAGESKVPGRFIPHGGSYSGQDPQKMHAPGTETGPVPPKRPDEEHLAQNIGNDWSLPLIKDFAAGKQIKSLFDVPASHNLLLRYKVDPTTGKLLEEHGVSQKLKTGTPLVSRYDYTHLLNPELQQTHYLILDAITNSNYDTAQNFVRLIPKGPPGQETDPIESTPTDFKDLYGSVPNGGVINAVLNTSKTTRKGAGSKWSNVNGPAMIENPLLAGARHVTPVPDSVNNIEIPFDPQHHEIVPGAVVNKPESIPERSVNPYHIHLDSTLEGKDGMVGGGDLREAMVTALLVHGRRYHRIIKLAPGLHSETDNKTFDKLTRKFKLPTVGGRPIKNPANFRFEGEDRESADTKGHLHPTIPRKTFESLTSILIPTDDPETNTAARVGANTSLEPTTGVDTEGKIDKKTGRVISTPTFLPRWETPETDLFETPSQANIPVQSVQQAKWGEHENNARMSFLEHQTYKRAMEPERNFGLQRRNKYLVEKGIAVWEPMRPKGRPTIAQQNEYLWAQRQAAGKRVVPSIPDIQTQPQVLPEPQTIPEPQKKYEYQLDMVLEALHKAVYG